VSSSTRAPAGLVLDHVVHVGAAILSPPRCVACDGAVTLRAVFCWACAALVERTTWDATGAAFIYGGPVARAIARMKYEDRPDLARPLGYMLANALAAHADRLTPQALAPGGERAVVVPVPLHPTRLAARGFNQSGLIAACVARTLGARFWPLALARSRDTSPQMAQGRAARLANVVGAFRARNPEAMHGRRVILVDDVRTTGATLEACARALLAAGAGPVFTATVARATDGTGFGDSV
jgi:ComF family protein